MAISFIPNDESMEIVALFTEDHVSILPQIINSDTTLSLTNSPNLANIFYQKAKKQAKIRKILRIQRELNLVFHVMLQKKATFLIVFI